MAFSSEAELQDTRATGTSTTGLCTFSEELPSPKTCCDVGLVCGALRRAGDRTGKLGFLGAVIMVLPLLPHLILMVVPVFSKSYAMPKSLLVFADWLYVISMINVCSIAVMGIWRMNTLCLYSAIANPGCKFTCHNVLYLAQMLCTIFVNALQARFGHNMTDKEFELGGTLTAICDMVQIALFHVHILYLGQVGRDHRSPLAVTISTFSVFFSSTYMCVDVFGNFFHALPELYQDNPRYAGWMTTMYSVSISYRLHTSYYNIRKLLLWDQSIFEQLWVL